MTTGLRGLEPMRRLWSMLVFVAVVVGAAVCGWLLEQEMRQQADATARATVRATADRIRLSLEIRVNANMQIAEGLATYVAANPDLNSADFARLSESLLRHRSEVRNMALARGTTVVAVYPLKGNEAVLGVDYRTVPDQWDDIRHVLEQGEAVVTGPVDLIQGGRAIIGRVPIFSGVDWPGQEVGEGPDGIWGIVSVPIDMDALFAYAGLTPSLPVDVALRGLDGRGADGAVFYGEPSLFVTARPELLTVRLPGGTWQMAAAPFGGWPSDAPWPGGVFAASLFGGLVLGGVAALAGARLTETTTAGGARRGPATCGSRALFLSMIEDTARTQRVYGRDVALLGFELPDDVAGRLSPDTCMAACAAAVRPDDALGYLAPGRYAVMVCGAGQEGAAVTAGFLRRALVGLDDGAAGTRFATVTLRDEDATVALALGRLDALLDEARHEPGVDPAGGPAV